MLELDPAIFHNIDKKDMYKQRSEVYCSKNEQEKKPTHFLLCGSCFWCASSLDLGGLDRIIKCPTCKDVFIKSFPIFQNELYKISYTNT
jgi:hypothetical protein